MTPKVVIIACLALASLALVTIPPEFKIQGKSYPVAFWPWSVNGFSLFLGSGIEPKKQEVDMIPDLAYSGLLVGEKTSSGWGVPCSPETGCHIDSAAPLKEFFYQNKQIIAKKGNTPLTIFREAKVPAEDYDHARFEFYSPVAGNAWDFGDFSVLGLSPKSSFLAHLQKVYTITLGLLIHFRKSDLRPFKIRNYDLTAYFNPAVETEAMFCKISLKPEDEFWQTSGKLTIGEDVYVKHQAKIVLSFHPEYLISVADPIGLCETVKKAACKVDDAEKCVRGKIDLKNAPILKFNLPNAETTFSGEDYIDFDGERVVCSFGSVSTLKSIGACPADTDIVLGKRFFEKHPLLIQPAASGVHSAVLLKDWKDPVRPSKMGGWMLWLIGLLVAAAIFLIAVYDQKRRGRANTDDSLKYQSI